MAEVGSILFTVDNFKTGDYGNVGGRHAPAGSFTGRNMIVRPNGRLGPRAGLADITPSSMPVGKLHSLNKTPVVGRDGMFTIGNTVYRFNLFSTDTPVSMGTFDTTPTDPLHPFLDTDVFYVAIPGDHAYRLDPTNDEVDVITDSPGGRDLLIRNGQMIITGDGTVDNPFYRLNASLPGDVNNWSEGRFLDVGDNWQITGIRTQRNYLAILKRRGAYVMSGILGDPNTQQLRLVSTTDTTLWPWNAELDAEDNYWYIGVFDDYVSMFNSANVEHLPALSFSIHDHDDPAALDLVQGLTVLKGDQTPSTVVVARGYSGQQLMVQQNGAWTLHDVEVNISGMITGDTVGPELIITDGGDVATGAKIYTTNFALNRPAFVSDVLVQPGDASTTPIAAYATMPQWWDPTDRNVAVNQVVVDFESYDTGTTATNHFDVTVRVLGRDRTTEASYSTADYDATALVTPPAPYDEAPSASSTSGTHQQRAFNFQCSPGSGVEITFSNVRGVDIESFTVSSGPRTERDM